jgi:glutamate-1-semialdehyde 2,1-aminomutase
MAAGIATLEALQAPGAYQRLEELGERLGTGMAGAGQRSGMPLQVQRVGSILTPFFNTTPVSDESTARTCDTSRYAATFHELLRRGVYPPPSQFEAWFVSLAHTESDVDQAVEAMEAALRV